VSQPSPPPAPVPTIQSTSTPTRTSISTDKLKADDIQTWSLSELDKKGKKKKGTLGIGNGALFFASESDKVFCSKFTGGNCSYTSEQRLLCRSGPSLMWMLSEQKRANML
jgi:hypothetical protein